MFRSNCFLAEREKNEGRCRGRDKMEGQKKQEIELGAEGTRHAGERQELV